MKRSRNRVYVLPLLLVLGGAACGDGAAAEEDLAPPSPADMRGPDDAGRTDAGPGDAGTLTGTYLLTLDAGAFPPTAAHPSALVYVPPGFDPTPPLSLVVYIHGFNNCVENIVRDQGESCDKAKGTPVRNAFSLAAQLRDAQRNALLLCPEVAFDQTVSTQTRACSPQRRSSRGCLRC